MQCVYLCGQDFAVGSTTGPGVPRPGSGCCPVRPGSGGGRGHNPSKEDTSAHASDNSSPYFFPAMSSLSSPPEGGFFRPRGPPGPPGPPPFPPPAHLKPRWPRPTPPPGNGRFPAPRSSARGAGPRMGGRMPPVGGSPPIRGGGAQRMMQRHPGEDSN